MINSNRCDFLKNSDKYAPIFHDVANVVESSELLGNESKF